VLDQQPHAFGSLIEGPRLELFAFELQFFCRASTEELARLQDECIQLFMRKSGLSHEEVCELAYQYWPLEDINT
jgi:hypothetical protein